MRSIVLVCFTALMACSESTEDPPLTATDSGAAADTSGTTTDAAPKDTGGGTTDAPAATDRAIINEIRSEDMTVPEYVELYNPTDKELDVGEWGIGGQKSDGSDDTPYVFAKGTKIAAKGYIVLTTNVKDDAACKLIAVMPCFFHDAGISGSRGEAIRLVDPSGKVVETAAIPAVDAETGPTLKADQSWGRLPNATGPFAANKPTPGKANDAA